MTDQTPCTNADLWNPPHTYKSEVPTTLRLFLAGKPTSGQVELYVFTYRLHLMIENACSNIYIATTAACYTYHTTEAEQTPNSHAFLN